MNKPRNHRSHIAPVRYVHSRRARKLRSRGENVCPFGRTSTGRAICVWFPKRGSAQ